VRKNTKRNDKNTDVQVITMIEYTEILNKMQTILDAKGHDYAAGEPFKNFKMCENFGVATEQGILVRISDKVSRIFNFFKAGTYKVKDESVEDTLLDLANYCVILIAYLNSNKKVRCEPMTDQEGPMSTNHKGVEA